MFISRLHAAGAATLALALIGGASVADVGAQSTHFCAGQPATIVPISLHDDNVVSGTSGDDVIFTGLGDDIVRSGGGRDVICTGRGHDTVYSGDGNDWVYGGGGNDTVFGAAGLDVLFGEAGRDRLYGEAGSDRHSGGDDPDVLDAAAGDDGSLDSVSGAEGDDTIVTFDGVANDVGSAGDGVDTCALDSGDNVTECEIP
jgi:Ca2+-binding RTX toxin-like protein